MTSAKCVVGQPPSVAIRALDFDDDLIFSGAEDQLIKARRSLQ